MRGRLGLIGLVFLLVIPLVFAFDGPPIATISPVNTTTNDVVSIVGTGTDTGSTNLGISTLTLFENGGIKEVFSCPGQPSFCSHAFTVTHTSPGSFTYFVRATDKSGQTGDSGGASVTFRGTDGAPTVQQAIPDFTLNEDSGTLDNLVDLFTHFQDAHDSDEDLTFSIVESDTSAVSCSVDSDRFIDCTTVANQFGK